MLLEFSVNNYKSIKDTAKFSMNIATRGESNTASIRKYKILLSSVFYGANATGKSNFLQALSFMSKFILNKYKVTQSTDKLNHQPFKLSSETENGSSTFESVFFVNETKYRYGFELDSEQIYSEWLFQESKGKESKLFFRDLDEGFLYVNKTKFKEGVGLKPLKNHLFLWKTDQEGGEVSSSILEWFNNLNLIDGSDEGGYVNIALEKLDNKAFEKEVTSFLKVADLGIEGIRKEEISIDSNMIEGLGLPLELKENMLSNMKDVKGARVRTKHKKYNISLDDYELVEFELHDESAGTKQFFFLSAPILDSLEKGKVLLIDEFGSSLHPMLSKYLVSIFNDKRLNKNNAQLIFVTHDTNMLDSSLFRRDQVWFAEKDNYGSTKIYSLADHKNIRVNENFEKNYLEGKYGAIPFLGNFDF